MAFDVRARLGEGDELTPVERVTLKAIGAGLDSVAELSGALALNQRLLLDLIYDFWMKGYVVIDHDSARVRLVGEAEDAARTGDWTRLVTAENNLENVCLLQELVSGAVLPDLGRRTPSGPESALVPTIMSGLELDVIDGRALHTALGDAVARASRQSGRPLVLREAWVDPQRILEEQRRRGGQVRRFLSLLADVTREPTSDELRFELVDAPRGLSPVIRRRIERKLTALARRFPDHLFFKRLRQQLDGGEPDAPRDPADGLQRLARTVRELDGVDPGLVLQRHAGLMVDFEEAYLELATLAAAQAEVRTLRGYAAHDAVIRELLAGARRQIVLGNPWIKLEALVEPGDDDKSWFDHIAATLDRGVQVVLFWGISSDATLATPVRNALTELRERHQQRFVWSSRPGGSHAKFVVRDAEEALLTSYNFFDPAQRTESHEIGVLVAGQAPGRTTAAILELLRWVRDVFPDHQLGRRIHVLAAELGADEPAAPRVPAPAQPDVQGDPELRGPALRHWAQSWQDTVTNLQAQRHALRRRVALVIDREHREALAHALRQADRRLAVLSDAIGIDVVNDRFVAGLRRQLARGVACAMVFRRQGASDSAAGPEARVAQLVDEFANFSLTNDNSHAKLLVVDDSVVIGSFNFLSFRGDYERGFRGESSELSIRIDDPAVVQDVLAALAERWPRAFTPLVARRGGAEPLPLLGPCPPALQPLFRALQLVEDRGPELLKWFAGRDAPWPDLEAMRDAGVPEPLLAQAVGAALAGATSLADGAARGWQRWLAEQRWRIGDFIGGALFVPFDEDAGGGLPRWLAEGGAAIEAGLPLAVGSLDRRHPAAALLVLADTLLHGRDPPEFDGAGLPRPLQRWLVGVREYHAATREPLPLGLLTQRAGAARSQQAVAAARERFAQALGAAEQVGFRFPLGQHTWDRLKTRGHYLGELRAALDAEDPTALAVYLAGSERDGTSPEALMDAASLAVRDDHNDRIDHPKRGVCLKRLNVAHAAAHAWVQQANTRTTAADGHRLGACWHLRRALVDLPSVPLDAHAEPVRKFLCIRLQPLFEAEEG
ncbi:MAG: hypothetical protein JNL82_35995 [Myxococcales bacterium]|nr:hypothetical protein [Myxococcales bacterium]